MEKYLTIYLIRHARQCSPLCNVDVELAEEGILQSRLLGKRLKAYGVEKVYSSHLKRAVMTADIVREELGIEQDIALRREQIREAFRETDFGEMTGLSDDVLKVKYADFFAEREECRKVDFPADIAETAPLASVCHRQGEIKEDLRIPGGENGQEVFERIHRAMWKVIREMEGSFLKETDGGNDEEPHSEENHSVAVISHGGAIRCYLAGVLGMPQPHRFRIAKNMENTAITELRYYYDAGAISVERINDYSHLDGHKELLRSHFK